MSAITAKQIKSRVQEQLRKSANAAANAVDPTEKGTPAIPEDPKNTKDKSQAPKDLNNQSLEGKDLTDKDTHPASTGKNVPSAADGNAQDANPSVKSASSKTAQILSRVRGLQKQAGNQSPAATEPKTTPVGTTTKSATAATDAEKLSLDSDAMLKLAAAIMETEEGIDLVTPLLRKQAGREAAATLIKEAAVAYQTQLERELIQDQLTKRAAAVEKETNEYLYSLYKSASSPAEGEQLVKMAKIHLANKEDLNEWEKSAYDQGVSDAADVATMPPGAEGEAGAVPGAEAPTLEQIIALLEQAINSGEIDEETATQIAQELIAAEQGGAGGEGGVPVEDPAAAPVEPAPEEEVKSASAQDLFKKIKARK